MFNFTTRGHKVKSKIVKGKLIVTLTRKISDTKYIMTIENHRHACLS